MAERTPPPPQRTAGVVVFGATVAGLTAAHELARRGIAVTVVVAPGETTGGTASYGWTPRRRIAPFGARGKRFPASSPVPAEVCADPIPSGARHLLDTLASIPSASRAKTLADELVDQPWRPLRRPNTPLPIHPPHPPRSAADVADATKAFVAAGYTPQDGHTFVARTLRFLTSSSRRREDECQTVSTTDYLCGANAAAVPPSCEYSRAFLADLADLPDPIIGTRPSVTDARTWLGAYAQSLAGGGEPRLHRRFRGGTRADWFDPWLAHLRDQLGVTFVTGRLARLGTRANTARGGRPGAGAKVTAEVARCSKSTQRLIARASHLIVATDAVAANSACARLPPIGVAGGLPGFTAEHARWERHGGIQLFLPDPFTLTGPLAVVGSPWRLVIRPQLAFHPRPPARTRDGFGAVLSVEVGAWDQPATRIGKPALACSERELAREIWAQIEDAKTLQSRGRRRVRPPSWFAADARVQLGRNGRVRSVARRLLCLPGDWSHRPGPEPRAGRSGAASSGRDLLWPDPDGGAPLHWKRLIFAGDYLKTLTRAAGAEAACESGRRAANAVISLVRPRLAPDAATPRFAPLFDPEAHELGALTDLKQLDDWCAQERLPHPFALAGVDGWISLVSWFGVLYPVSEPFMKTILEKLLAMARAAGQKTDTTGYQEGVLEALRNLREALQREFRRAPGASR